MTTKLRRKKNVSRLPADQRIADIVTAARVVIAERGYEAASMAAIAERAGVVEGTLYRFFKTKQELMLRVAEDWLEEQLTEDRGWSAIRGTWNRLRHLVWRALLAMREQPEVSRFVLIEMRPTRNYRETRLFQLNRRFTSEVRAVCREAIQAGEWRTDVSPALVRDMVFGCIEHQTWAFLRGEGDFRIDEVADNIAHLICRGMASAPGKATELDAPIESVVARLEKVARTLEREHGPQKEIPGGRGGD